MDQIPRARGFRLVIAVTACLAVFGFPAAPAQAGEAELREAVSSALMAQHGASARHTYSATALETLVEPKRAQRGWVFGGAVIRVPDGVSQAPVTALFLAQRHGSTWTVALEGTPEFAAAAAKAPVIDSGERELFTNTVTTNAATGLGLPWKQGQGWAHWGVHGNSGDSYPYNSIDFYGGDGRVLASRAGRMYRFCTSGRWPFIKVVHDNGYTTGYYHLSSTTNKGDGATVAEGEYLGMIDVQLPCGGRANGDHVHWTLWQGNSAVSVVGKTIGGWTWYSGSSAYQGYAERNGQKVYRNYCCPIVNYGSGTGDPGNPTGTVNAGSYDYINVRSGPGLNYSVVGQAYDGDVIEIVCTARGDSVTGPWNNTTDIWDRMPDGSYITDAFVDTGSNEPVAPPC